MARLLIAVRERALRRPWLLVPPLLGLLVQNAAFLLSPGSVAGRTVLTAVLTSLAAALFAELWIGDGWSADPSRVLSAWKLYLIPYALLLIFGAVSTPFVYWLLHADLPPGVAMSGLYAVVALGKLAAFALGAASSLAVAVGEGVGALAALRAGAAAALRGARLLLPALACVWLFQEAAVYLARALAPGLLAGFLTAAIPLLGCVAMPLEARRLGLLDA